MAGRPKSNGKSKKIKRGGIVVAGAGTPRGGRGGRPSGGRGGRRTGAGRRARDPDDVWPGGIDWEKVRHFAFLGANRDLIVAGLGITPEQLEHTAIVDRLRLEVERGAALFRLELLADLRSLRKDGKVNAVLAGLRQALGWDRRDSGKRGDDRPDDGAALAELEKFLGGVASARSPEDA